MAQGEVVMSAKRYADEFKIEAVRQVVVHDRSIADLKHAGGLIR